MYTTIWSKNMKGRDHLEAPWVDSRITLEWILGKLGAKVWTGCIWLRAETSGLLFSEPSGSIKEGEFLDYLSDSAPWS